VTLPAHPAEAEPPRGNALLAKPSPGAVRAGSLPVEVGPPDTTHGPVASRVRVSVASHQAAQRAGVSGVIFEVARADGSRSAGEVHVSLNYSAFAAADLGGYADRLRLVELPVCALTTPQLPACRAQTPLKSFNNVKATALGADVTLSGSAALILAGTEGTSGSGGNFGAEPLSQSANWSAGGSSGAFTYSYDISVPPVPGGLEPSVSFGYNSQSVDGLTSSTNAQASWIGDGWSYDPGYVERDYQTCAANSSLPAADKTGDLCWNSSADVTTLVLNGTSTTLVDDPSKGWVPEANNGETVSYLTKSGTNGTHDGDYWVVTDTHGTSYYFGLNELTGWASPDAKTNSALTVPVYGPVSGDPCYNATFSKASCAQAWRWQLDYVTDAHGDAIAYFYNNETNYYATDNGTKATASYIQGAALSKIEYGFRAGAVYSTTVTPSAEVLFTAPETRTDIPTSTTNGNTDLACASGAACTVTSPTFWSKYQLSTVATQALNNKTLQPVDSWSLTHTYETNTSETYPALWLSSIAHTGQDGGTSSPLGVSFAWQPLANRANLTDGYDPINRDRLSGIVTETGQDITVTYSSASCPSTRPTDDANTSLCYPSWWTPSNKTSFEDWFNKYVVTSVSRGDGYSIDAQPAVQTKYCYGSQSNCLSGGAWHYDDDTLVRSDQRTWDQWRGFQQVWTTTGSNSDPTTQTEDQYFRGMNGDYQNGSTTTTSTLTSVTGNVPATDSPQYAGMNFEHIVYNGVGGAMVTDTVTTPWSQQTGSQSQPSPLPALTSNLTGQAKVQTFTALASGGNRESDTTYGHNSYGLVTSVASAPDALDNGSAGPTSEDTCTQTSYAQNTTTNQVDLPAEVIVTSVTPANCPISSSPTQGQLISDTRDYYDSSTTLGAIPSAGNLTQVTKATSYLSGAEQFTTQATDLYDEYGRITSATNADSHTTTTSYSPLTGAEPTSITMTTAPTPNDSSGLGTITAFDPLRELPLSVTNPDGTLTSETYDPLGRRTAVWLPTASESGGQNPSYAYIYTVNTTAPSVVTTNTIEPNGTAHLTSETFYDSTGQPIQTQTQTPDGNMDVTMTFYNSDGWKSVQFNPFYAVGGPSTSPVSATNSSIPYQIAYTYDGAGRVTKQVTWSGANQEYETDSSYGGDYVTTTPPASGTPETVYTNGAGLTTDIYQYHSSPAPASPPTAGTGNSSGAGGWDHTSYTYYPSRLLDTITDSAGSQWSYGYDFAGNRTSSATPDTGTTSATYDNAGNLLSTTNADNQTISYHYDAVGRMDAEYAATVANQSASNEVAAWVFDSLANGKGRLTSATAYVGGTSGAAYTTSVLAYTTTGLSKGTQTKIPSGPLAGTYTTEYLYDNAGDLSQYIDLAAGGLPQETVNLGYDAAAQPVSVTSALANYVSALSYTELGQPQEYNFGPTTSPATLYDSYNYRYQLSGAQTSTGTSPVVVDNQNYTYDNNGNVTSDADTPSGGAAQSQCFQYDYLGRLQTAWSQASSDCSAGPSQTAEATATAPYQDAYHYNAANDLTQQVSTPGTGTATTFTNTFPATTGAKGPHAIDNQQAQGPNGTTTTSYGYDAAGFTTSIAVSGGATDTLNWNGTGQVPGELASISNGSSTVASYVYDPSGHVLLQTDGSTTTLYLPDEQITNNNGTLSGVRYYSLGGQTVAARTSGGSVDYLVGNQQGTDTVAIDASTLATTTRYFDPYGNPLTATPSTWPGTRGFVGGTADVATGLTNIGAREYNPGTGSFITTDPILKPYNPQDLNPYAYAGDTPATASDPTGLGPPPMPPIPDGCGFVNCPTSTTGSGPGSVNGPGSDSGKGVLPHKKACTVETLLDCLNYSVQLNDGSQAGTGNTRDWSIVIERCSSFAGAFESACANLAASESGASSGAPGSTPSGNNDDIAGVAATIADAFGTAAEDGSAAINTSRELGMDPATGKFRQSEYETALRIEQERGVVLERSADPRVDWVDTSGNSYDAVGNFGSKYFEREWPNLQTRILDHMIKADFVPVDVAGFTEAQIAQVQQFIDPLGPSVFMVGE
jgi:RHS repeat-associated protein